MKKFIFIILFITIFLQSGISIDASEINKSPQQLAEDEDPQFGREHGYSDEDFFEAKPYSLKKSGYIHNTRFDGYEIREVIDVSKYQGDIDWDKVKESGIDFAFIRAGFRGYGKSGTLKTDDYYKRNIRGALDSGLEVGVYFFSQAITEKEAQAEAEYVLELIKGYDVSLPIVIDYEYASSSSGHTGRLYNAGLPKSAATKICRKFCATILEQGYTPMVYANKSMLEKGVNASEIAKNYKIWLANYTTKTSYQGEYEFWQYTQNGTVDGINGNVDKSFWYIPPEKNDENKTISENVSDTLAERIYGETRYETSFKIAEMLRKEMSIEKFDNIIVANGENFADALSGSYLAAEKNAPILLTNGRNAQDIKDYIKKKLKPDGTVYLLGGTAALPEGVGCGLSQFRVKRLWGATRYETNIEILKEAGISGEEILICAGNVFADSLSCSATRRPILLVGNKLTEIQKEFLNEFSGNKLYIIGGPKAVSTSLENEIKLFGNTERIGGATRYETSTMVAGKFFDSPSSVVLAYSHNFPDGLCGGPLAMSAEAPLILTKPGSENSAREYAKGNGINTGYILGGPSLVTDGAVGKILGQISEPENEAMAKIVLDADGGFAIEYQTILNKKNSADEFYYLMQSDSHDHSLTGSPIAIIEKEINISICANISDRSLLNEIIMDKLVLAVKLSDGTYQAVNTPIGILNPEIIANNKSPIFKASSKKGLQGVAFAHDGREITDARYANTKQTLFNLDLAKVVGTGPSEGYIPYEYKGNTYYFSECSALRESIQTLNGGYQQYLYGNDGTTKVAVSLCLLLSYREETSYLIDLAARTPGHAYYMLNVQEKRARETLEAVFLYLGEIFGQEECYVTNWILGNEINSSKAWNYSGSLEFETYIQRYATAFQILYNGVKAQKIGNTVCISLDNGWNAAPDTYAGKVTLDQFAKSIHKNNPNIEWSVAYHAYSYPLNKVDFWNDSSNTTNSVSTKYISMKNIKVLTNYVAEVENTYSKQAGSIRVLLTEQGYTHSAGEKNQATAIARAYYTAEFNDRIDAFIIRAVVDAPEETSSDLYFGLMNTKTEKRTSFYVYEYMDSDLRLLENISAQGTVSPGNYEKFDSAKEILCDTNWGNIISGFDVSKLTQMK